jgi:membrane protein
MGALLRETWSEFTRHRSQWLAAALAYYAIFAIAPLIIVAVEVAGFFLRTHSGALDLVYHYLHSSTGTGEDAVRSIVDATFNQPHRSIIAQIVAWGIFVIAAVGLFNGLQFALNTIWDVVPERMTIALAIRERAWSFIIMLAIALLLLLTLILNTAMAALRAQVANTTATLGLLVHGGDLILSFFVLWAAFAVMFEFLPDYRIAWRYVWIGAGVTSFFFVIGQFLVGLYLGHSGVTSAYGAFGSLIALLIWVNYSAQIVLFGAQFTRTCERRSSNHVDH